MISNDILVVLINYSRPDNMRTVIDAWRPQTRNLVVVDNSPLTVPYQPYPDPYLTGADDIWRFKKNAGCPCRFAPVMFYNCKYVIFADDDLLPGPDAVDHLLYVANQLEGCFATIGQLGRRFNGTNYCTKNYAIEGRVSACDITCRCHLWSAENLSRVIDFRRDLRLLGFTEARLSEIHDDMLLCLGIQRSNGYPSYVLPSNNSKQFSPIAANLDECGKALWRRPNHFIERNQFIQAAINVGWKSLV